jgi:filamentous hemagglutinin family protein
MKTFIHIIMTTALAVTATAALLSLAGTARALPSGGSVAAGSVTISTPSAATMQITQTSNRGIVNWNSFGIAGGEAVNITQPSSTSSLLNRVTGGSASQIYGSLTSNGQVFLINPNGVLFGKGASVNVGGLVASSLNITDDNFMNNKLKFFKDGSAGSVVNQGGITAGFAALLGPQVDNSGSIVTLKGSAALGAADAITLNFDTGGLIALTLDQGAYNAQVQNSGIIEADGGKVILTAKSADSIVKSMVNNTGVIHARSVDSQNGQILRTWTAPNRYPSAVPRA